MRLSARFSQPRQRILPFFFSLFFLLGASCNVSSSIPVSADQDQDGYSIKEGDCNDEDSTIYPNAPEIIDEQDNDCDDEIDEDFQTGADGAGEGGNGSGEGSSTDNGDQENGQGNKNAGGGSPNDQETKNQPNPYEDDSASQGGSVIDRDGDGFTMSNGDCNDGDFSVHPYTQEISCNPIDENCDGVVPFMSNEIFLGDTQYGTRVDCDDYTAACGKGSQEKYAQNVITYMGGEPLIQPEQCLLLNGLVDAAYPPKN